MMPMRMGGIDMICKGKKIEVNGFTWYFQEFIEGDKHEFNLYDSDGDFVAEFDSMEEMMRFVL